jgi:hypothetical protein
MGIEAIYRRANTSRRHPAHPVFPYLLRQLVIDRPNRVWAADVTYIPMERGFVYLVAMIDWFSRKVLSWLPILSAFSSTTGSASAWTVAAPGATTCSSSGCGAP